MRIGGYQVKFFNVMTGVGSLEGENEAGELAKQIAWGKAHQIKETASSKSCR